MAGSKEALANVIDALTARQPDMRLLSQTGVGDVFLALAMLGLMKALDVPLKVEKRDDHGRDDASSTDTPSLSSAAGPIGRGAGLAGRCNAKYNRCGAG